MAYTKRHYNFAANSILESVIALSIISVCLYIAVLVYASVFSPRTAPKFYGTRNKLDELYFMIQVQHDTISSVESDNLLLEEESITTNLKKITIKYKDSSKNLFEKQYYINQTNE